MKRNNTSLHKATGIILTLVSILFISESRAQTIKTDFYSPLSDMRPAFSIEGRLFYGFINNYHNELKIFDAHVPAFEISLSQSTDRKNDWGILYNYPKLGLSVFYTPFNKSEGLGKAIGLYPYIDFPLLKTSGQNLSLRLGLGLAYFDTKFHPTENYQNLAIGSSLNVLAHFMLNYQLELTKKNRLSFGLGLIHFSNGSITTPNYGLNLPLVSLAFAHSFKENTQKLNTKSYPLFHYDKNNDLRLDFQVAYGVKEQNDNLNETFQIITQSLTLFKPLNKKLSIGLGFDFSWDESHKTLLLEQGISPPSGLGLAKYATAANFELKLEKLAFKFGLGAYVYAKEKTEGPIYEKLAINYLFHKNLYGSIELKAHAARAAYIGWGIGYQLQLNTRKR